MFHINTLLNMRLNRIYCSTFRWVFFNYKFSFKTIYIRLDFLTVFINLINRVSCKVAIKSFTHIVLSELERIVINFIPKINSMSSNSNHTPRLATTRITKNNTQVARAKSSLNTIVKNRPRRGNGRTVISSIPSFNIFIILMSNIFIHTSFHCFLYLVSNTIEVSFFK